MKNGECFEIGTIQAFLDGETIPEVSLRLTDHVSSCDACARVMADADEENSTVFSTLDRELNSLVPTQRLWSRINETIEVQKSQVTFWEKAIAFVRSSLVNPSIMAAAGVLLMLGLLAIVTLRTGNNVAIQDVAVTPPVSNAQTTVNVDVASTDLPIQAPGSSQVSTSVQAAVGESKLPAKEIRSLVQNAAIRSAQREIKPQTADYRVSSPASIDAYIPGEESYVRTISDLKQSIDGQKDTVMSPSSRVSYERDMAIVNDSINRMRDAVKKNPKNQAARQVLYSSYQDKIDLLNSVAQREELMARLR